MLAAGTLLLLLFHPAVLSLPMGFSVGWDSPQLFTLTFVSTGLTGAVWWAGGGQELWSHPTEAGGGSGNLSSWSPSVWEKFQVSFYFATEQKMLAKTRQGSAEGGCWGGGDQSDPILATPLKPSQEQESPSGSLNSPP